MRSTLFAGFVAVLAAGSSCAGPDSEPASAVAQEAYCGGLYLAHVVKRAGTVFYVSPDTLATATDGWGPQTLALSVDQGFAPQVSYQTGPSVTKTKDKISKTIQEGVGFSLSTSVRLSAISTVAVPIGAFYRLEAYPEYQVVDWELHVEACNFLPDTVVTRGSAYRPMGIHFRVLEYVGGTWNAVDPPSPAELLAPPPWATAGGGA